MSTKNDEKKLASFERSVFRDYLHVRKRPKRSKKNKRFNRQVENWTEIFSNRKLSIYPSFSKITRKIIFPLFLFFNVELTTETLE